MSFLNRSSSRPTAADARADLAERANALAPDSDDAPEPSAAAAVDFDDLSADPTRATSVRGVPFIGGLPLAVQQTVLGLMVVVGLIGVLGVSTLSLLRARSGTLEALDAGRAQTQAQRMAKAAAQAVLLDGRAFAELRDSHAQLGAAVAAIQDRTAAGNPEADAALQQALPLIERTRARAAQVLAQQAPLLRASAADGAGGQPDDIAGLLQARDAQRALANDSDAVRQALDTVQARIAEGSSFGTVSLLSLVLSLLLLLCGAAGFVDLFVREQAERAAVAEGQRREAQRQEREAKRVNDANQAAILRLMNELQTVSEGDLTQQATVTEDITGAIADSVNYTVEELRALVAQVQGTVERVTATTAQVEANSTELLATSTEQLREIRDTGESVLQMAGRINNVSAQAQQTASVARQSLQAAESGLRAVQNSIGGMNLIRDQMQETSKRIKRLGESSQEIGDITELISDITEQTNVLALNAAIQAASAGEAGRGFSVVAQEVQRLAERSADATRQISALVKTIQADTQDAVSSVESSTQNVVEGARLTDAAGGALGDIDRVSRRLSELIVQISNEALSEANSANVVAVNIQHIFAVTEQTGEGTRSTAQIVRELAKSADELRRSVARFKIV